jgi:hypothetical protein
MSVEGRGHEQPLAGNDSSEVARGAQVAALSRRQLLKDLAWCGGAGLTFSTITSLAAPDAAIAAPFRNMSFAAEPVPIQFGDSVVQEFSVSGAFTVAPNGVVTGQGEVQLPDGTVALIDVQQNDTEIQYGSITLNLMVNSLDTVGINGQVVPVESWYEAFANENDFTGIAPLSDLSRASLAGSALASTEAFRRNAKVARKLADTPIVIDDWWCAKITKYGTYLLFALGAVAVLNLALSCVTTIVLPIFGAVSCAVAAAIASAMSLGFAIVHNLIADLFWKP